jgi:hypothetical protein
MQTVIEALSGSYLVDRQHAKYKSILEYFETLMKFESFYLETSPYTCHVQEAGAQFHAFSGTEHHVSALKQKLCIISGPHCNVIVGLAVVAFIA